MNSEYLVDSSPQPGPRFQIKTPRKLGPGIYQDLFPEMPPFGYFLQFWENTFICIYSRLIVPALKPDTVGD